MPKIQHYKFATNPTTVDTVNSVAPTFARATSAWAKDSDGWLREYQDNEPRFQGAAWSQNVSLQTGDLTDAAWDPQRLTMAASAQTDPDGGTNAYSATPNTDNNTHFLYDSAISLDTSAAPHCLSVYAKANGYDHLCLMYDGYTAMSAWFDLTNGTVGTTSESGAGDYLDSGIEDAGNGWYRCWVVGTLDTNSNFLMGVGNTGENSSFIGDGSSGILLYRPQQENVAGAWDSENLILQSNDFDTNWTNINSTDSGGLSDPDGGSDAWSINEDATASNSHYMQQSITFPEAGTYMLSIKAKASNRDWFNLSVTNLPAVHSCYFDLTNGVLGTEAGATGAISSLGNGWYLCSIIFEVDSSDLVGNTRLRIAEADNDLTFDGLSQESILIYQAQMEHKKPSQTAPGTYTATTTAAVTNYSPSTYIATTTAAVSSVSGANDGYYAEQARTNICLRSEDFSTTWATGSQAVVNTDQTIAPDGSTTADQIIDNAATGSNIVSISQAVTVATSTAYTYSVFAKADQLGWMFLRLNNFTTPASNTETWFDLSTGVVGTSDAGFDDAGIEDYGNGWYRCWGSFTTDGTDTTGTLVIGVADADTGTTVDLDGTSSIFVWGAQLEAGGMPSSYIPTTTGSVTRNKDDLSALSLAAGTFPAGACSIFSATEFITTPVSSVYNNDWIVTLRAGSNDYFTHVIQDTDRARLQVRSGGATSCAVQPTTDMVAGTTYNWVSGSDTDDFVFYLNGTAGTPDTSGALPVGDVDDLYIGNTALTNTYNGLIKEIAIWDERLDNATLLDYSQNGLPTASLTGIKYPRDSMPTGEQRFQDFIDATGITKTNELIDDYKAALASLTGLDPDDYSIDDLFKIYWESL